MSEGGGADWAILEFSGEEGRRITRARLAERSAKLATWLDREGLRPGERVCFLMENSIPVFEVLGACQLLGLRAVPLNAHFTASEARYVLEDSGARALVTSQKHLARAAEASAGLTALDDRRLIADSEAREGFAPLDAVLATATPWTAPPPPAPGVVIYTSGTTGRPKGVLRAPLPEADAAAYLGVFRDVCRLGEAPTHLVTGPLHHSAPSAFARNALQLGGRLVVMDRFDAEAVLAAIERFAVTNVHLVPTMMSRLLALPEATRGRYDLGSLRSVQHAAAPCPPELKQAMIRWWGPLIDEYYGSTEAGLVTYLRSDEALARPGSVGRALPGMELCILGPEGERQGPGVPGDIAIANAVTRAFTYLGDPEKRANAARGDHYLSGDIGYLDEAGYLYVCDRRADMIISGGVNIYPAEIEAALLAHEAIADCAVFGVPSAEWGEAVHAVVQLRVGRRLDEAELARHLAPRLARYKLPRSLSFADELPREPSGKLLKRKLRDPYWQGRRSALV